MFKQYGLVFPATKHFCPICNKHYDDYQAAKSCIDSHAKPECLEAYQDLNETHNCPEFVFISLSDGRTAKYQVCCVFNSADNNAEPRVEPHD